jgi:hypothetical protein
MTNVKDKWNMRLHNHTGKVMRGYLKLIRIRAECFFAGVMDRRCFSVGGPKTPLSQTYIESEYIVL